MYSLLCKYMYKFSWLSEYYALLTEWWDPWEPLRGISAAQSAEAEKLDVKTIDVPTSFLMQFIFLITPAF